MQDCDARLNVVVVRGCHGDGMHVAGVFVFIDPATHMLVHERPHLRGPGFDLRAGGFAILQGDDELRSLAVGDVEDPALPRVKGGDGGRTCERFARGGVWGSEQGSLASVRSRTLGTQPLRVEAKATISAAESLRAAAGTSARHERLAAPIANALLDELDRVALLRQIAAACLFG